MSRDVSSAAGPSIHLVGSGVVGRAIVRAHLDAGLSVYLSDLSERSLTDALEELPLDPLRWQWRWCPVIGGKLPTVALRCLDDAAEVAAAASHRPPPLLIESISERLDAKREFFLAAEQTFGPETILCSNTSTLRIASLAEPLRRPESLCGMHFFMPVERRPAVEIIASSRTAAATTGAALRHAERLGKQPLIVADGPGFVVNRMLTPYLNQAALLITRGATAEQLESAAMRFGMPMSPLELIDWIGTRTAFDAGRVFWQAFPSRIDPAAILAGLIKQGRGGRASGGGFYDYASGERSARLAPAATELCDHYARGTRSYSDDEVEQLLALPMWIEAASVLRDAVAADHGAIETAMAGGLGYTRSGDWFGYFDRRGCASIGRAIATWSPSERSMTAPPGLLAALERAAAPSEAVELFADQER